MTTDERLDALERELGRTKRVNRWLLAVIGVIVVAGFTALTVTGQEKRVPMELRARAFILEDANGNTRAGLTMRDWGPALNLYDANGKLRAGLSVLNDGSPGLALADANKNPRALLSLLNDGSPALNLFDANGRTFWTTRQIKRTP